MSHSFKKQLVAKERNDKHNKKSANKKVRRYSDDIANGKAYKKIYESYDICDFAFIILNEDEVYDCTDKHERFNRIKDFKNK